MDILRVFLLDILKRVTRKSLHYIAYFTCAFQRSTIFRRRMHDANPKRGSYYVNLVESVIIFAVRALLLLLRRLNIFRRKDKADTPACMEIHINSQETLIMRGIMNEALPSNGGKETTSSISTKEDKGECHDQGQWTFDSKKAFKDSSAKFFKDGEPETFHRSLPPRVDVTLEFRTMEVISNENTVQVIYHRCVDCAIYGVDPSSEDIPEKKRLKLETSLSGVPRFYSQPAFCDSESDLNKKAAEGAVEIGDEIETVGHQLSPVLYSPSEPTSDPVYQPPEHAYSPSDPTIDPRHHLSEHAYSPSVATSDPGHQGSVDAYSPSVATSDPGHQESVNAYSPSEPISDPGHQLRENGNSLSKPTSDLDYDLSADAYSPTQPTRDFSFSFSESEIPIYGMSERTCPSPEHISDFADIPKKSEAPICDLGTSWNFTLTAGDCSSNEC